MSAALAEVLRYPKPGYREGLAALRGRLGGEAPETLAAVDRLLAYAAERGEAELEEAYTQTFDLNPDCALEVGWHLYGEDYKRGEFLVEMRRLMRRVGVPEDGELPDHLVHALEVLARLEGGEARALAGKVLAALAKMRKAADGQPFDAALAAVEAHLKRRFPADGGEKA